MMKSNGLLGPALATFFVLLAPAPLFAQVARYALVIGHNRGAPNELALRYAESDADKMALVLRTLGRVPAENLVQLRAPNANEAQRALIAINARIRLETGPGRDSVLLVYYSGHADAGALHLGGERLDLSLLERLVQGSPADVRLLVLDACRSGVATRRKGGRAIEPFPVPWETELSGEGLAVLAASAADEDAQESDTLRGSFFTHYLVSALRGAGDSNANSVVTLEEAYAYAYQRTLQASSQTVAGAQHPSFHFDLEGRSSLPLTWLADERGRRGWLTLPNDREYLILMGHEAGPVVAEVGPTDRRRRLALEPGSYFLRGRARTHLLEGTVRLRASEDLVVREEDMARVDYARLARKGGAGRGYSHGPRIGYRTRSPLWNDTGYCHGPTAGYELDLPQLTVSAGLAFCRTSFDNASVSTTADDLAVRLGASRVIDMPFASLAVGLGLGASWLHQSFDTRALAPDRHSLAWSFGPEVRAYTSLRSGYFAVLEGSAGYYVLPQSTAAGRVTVAPFTGFLGAGLAKKF